MLTTKTRQFHRRRAPKFNFNLIDIIFATPNSPPDHVFHPATVCIVHLQHYCDFDCLQADSERRTGLAARFALARSQSAFRNLQSSQSLTQNPLVITPPSACAPYLC